MAKWRQPSLFSDLAFLSRRRKIVKSGKDTYRTGRTRGRVSAPLGITFLGQRAARSKVARGLRRIG